MLCHEWCGSARAKGLASGAVAKPQHQSECGGASLASLTFPLGGAVCTTAVAFLPAPLSCSGVPTSPFIPPPFPQVVDIPEELLEEHDIAVDYILTPTRVITTGCERPQPMGITWSKISREMMEKIPVLRSLRAREQQAGKDVTLQGEHQHLPEPGRQQAVPLSAGRRPPDTPGPEANSMEAARGSPAGEGAPLAADVYVGNLPRDARVSDLKRALRELGSVPLRLTWQGPQRRAFLRYPDSAAAQQAVSCLQGLRLGTDTLRVALARQQRDK